MATWLKFCMSSIFCRPDSQTTSISPDARMLRKLVRDRTCRPALRWILESLLEYLTHKLAKWSTRNVNPKPGLGTVAETNVRNKESPVQRTEDSMKPSSTTIQRLDLQNLSQGILRSSQKERLCSRYKGDQIEDSAPRCLTSFKLLQAKFTRSTPKPLIAQQREVGSLPSNRGLAGNVNHSQDREQETHKGKQYWAKKEQGQRRVGSVKDIVARFAVVEQKEMGGNMQQQQPVKPRLIGRGLLLSSLMERFETTATVRKGGDLKSSNERRPGGVKVTGNVKQMVACHERGHQQGAVHCVDKQRQLQQMKSKSAEQQLKGIQTAERPDQSMDISTNGKSNMRLQSHLTTKQISDRPSDQETKGHCSLKHTTCQPCDNDGEGWSSGESQTAVEETQRVAGTLKYGHLQLLCSTSVIEWSLPEPHRVFIQVETPMSWHVATILPCFSVWSLACIDSSPKQYFKKPKCGTLESTQLGNIPHSLEEAPHEAVQCSPVDAATSEPCGRVPERNCAGQNPIENKAEEHGPQKDATIQGRLPKYLIPRIYRCEDQPSADQTAPSPETMISVDRMLASPSDTSMTDFNYGNKTMGNFQDVPSHRHNPKIANTNHHSVTKTKAAEGKPGEKDGDDREGQDSTVTPADNNTNVPQSLRISEVDVSEATFKDSNAPAVALPNQILPQTDKQKQRPKYTTINYGDPSVKHTYKPKIIRFTDTFTF